MTTTIRTRIERPTIRTRVLAGQTKHAALTDTDTDGHPASAITGLGSAALEDADAFDAAGTAAAAVAAHTGDTSDAHDASAISFAATGGLASTDVQAALAELDTEKSATGHNHSGVYDPAGTAAALVDDLSGVTDAATARTNLGLGSLATLSSVGAAQIDADAVGASELAADAVVDENVAAAANITGTKVAAATTAARGTVELATTAETQTGTDADRAVTPAGAAAAMAATSLAIASASFPRISGAVYGTRGAASSGARAEWDAVGDFVAVPVFLPAGSYSSIRLHFTGSAGNQVWRFMVYEMGANGLPGVLLADGGTVTMSGGAAHKQAAVSVTIDRPRFVWLAFLVETHTTTATVSYLTYASSTPTLGFPDGGGGGNIYQGVTATGVATGSAPNPAPSTSIGFYAPNAGMVAS